MAKTSAAKNPMKAAIITGGAHGIGLACAVSLQQAGFAVCIVDINKAALTTAATSLLKRGPAIVMRKDVSKEADVKAVIAATVRAFGGIDVVVNNASHADPFNAPLASLSLKAWQQRLAVSLTGPLLYSKYAEKHLRERRGSIINISSTRAQMSEKNTEAYSACKGGLEALTRALAISLGPKIRVNAIAPGWIDTRDQRGSRPLGRSAHAQHPCGRVGVSEDIGSLVVYLAADAAGFITGQTIVVDGGMSVKMIYQ